MLTEPPNIVVLNDEYGKSLIFSMLARTTEDRPQAHTIKYYPFFLQNIIEGNEEKTDQPRLFSWSKITRKTVYFIILQKT